MDEELANKDQYFNIFFSEYFLTIKEFAKFAKFSSKIELFTVKSVTPAFRNRITIASG